MPEMKRYRFVFTRDGSPVEEMIGSYKTRSDARFFASKIVEFRGGQIEIWSDKDAAKFPLEVVG